LLSEPRTLSLLTDLIHVPARYTMEQLRGFYNAVSSACEYENFTRTADGARIERSSAETAETSTLTLRSDRLQMVEDNTTLPLDHYIQKLQTVAKKAMETLHISCFLLQQTTVRAIASPNAFKTASEFISKALFKIKPEDLGPIGRPTSLIGLRLFFPSTNEAPHQFNVRIEMFIKDNRSIYIENVGTFKTPVTHQTMELLGANVQASADFISNNLCRFLSRFDNKEPEL
jgi:hypothetical protein